MVQKTGSIIYTSDIYWPGCPFRMVTSVLLKTKMILNYILLFIYLIYC